MGLFPSAVTNTRHMSGWCSAKKLNTQGGADRFTTNYKAGATKCTRGRLPQVTCVEY